MFGKKKKAEVVVQPTLNAPPNVGPGQVPPGSPGFGQPSAGQNVSGQGQPIQGQGGMSGETPPLAYSRRRRRRGGCVIGLFWPGLILVVILVVLGVAWSFIGRAIPQEFKAYVDSTKVGQFIKPVVAIISTVVGYGESGVKWGIGALPKDLSTQIKGVIPQANVGSDADSGSTDAATQSSDGFCVKFLGESPPDTDRNNPLPPWENPFEHIWWFENCGNTTWEGVTAVRYEGDDGPEVIPIPVVKPGYKVAVSVVIPSLTSPGIYSAKYRFHHNGKESSDWFGFFHRAR